MAGKKQIVRVEANDDIELAVVRGLVNTYADAQLVQAQYGQGSSIIVSSETAWRTPDEAREHAMKVLALADWLDTEISCQSEEAKEWDGLTELQEQEDWGIPVDTPEPPGHGYWEAGDYPV